MKAPRRGIQCKSWTPSGIGTGHCLSKVVENREDLCDGCAAAKLRHERDQQRNDSQPKAKGIRQLDPWSYGIGKRR